MCNCLCLSGRTPCTACFSVNSPPSYHCGYCDIAINLGGGEFDLLGSWELISWEVDFVGVDFVGVDLVHGHESRNVTK